MSRTRTAICPGSFDPPTYGHCNIIERGQKLFARLIVAVATNSTKQPLFTVQERVEMLRQIFRGNRSITIDAFDGLLVDYARRHNVTTILRGIRTMSDYEYELQMAFANRAIAPTLETVFLMTDGRYSHINSSIIKDVCRYGGDARTMIPPIVERALRKKLNP